MMKFILFGEKMTKKTGGKDNQAQGNRSLKFIFTLGLHNCGYLHMNKIRLLFLEFDWQMTKTDKVVK